jgi:casein kinase II subunit alpha
MSEEDLQLHAAPAEAAFPVPTIVSHRFNPLHPLISAYYENVNLESGPSHWSFRRWNPAFGVLSRYSISRLIGSGRYSDVFIGHVDDNICAIKILKRINPDKIRREAKVLMNLNGHPNILSLSDILCDPRSSVISLVTDYVENVPWKALIGEMKLDDIRFYIYRILQALQFSHERGIMHRDIKPSNILCTSPRGTVKVADWGLAEFYHPLRKYSHQVGTLRYQAPELLVDFGYYHYSVDVWSVGCILLGALCGRKWVFEGKTSVQVMGRIATLLGGQGIAKWFRKYRMAVPPEMIESFERIPADGFDSLFGITRRAFKDPEGIELVHRMLKIDHKKRISAREALDHPFFAIVRDAGTE